MQPSLRAVIQISPQRHWMSSDPAGEGTRRTCRLCHADFMPSCNSGTSCRYHPESFAGETAQRWLAPGDKEHRNEVYYFYSCCGQGLGSPGCCYSRHVR